MRRTGLAKASAGSRGAARGRLRLDFLAALLVAVLGSSVAVARAQEAGEARCDLFIFLTNGRPAANAVVRVMGAEGERPSLDADEQGRARVEGLKPGDAVFFLATSADGRESAFVPVLVIPRGHRTMTVRLYPLGFVVGELLDEKGDPVDGVTIRLSGWEWLKAPELAGGAETDARGSFRISGLVAGAYYSVAAAQGPSDAPTRTWLSETFRMHGWDGWYNVGILLPEGSELSAPRPDGETLVRVASGPDDKWYDTERGEWQPAVATYDPNRGWTPAPDDATWIWRAGRTDAAAERNGATVEFSRRFTVPEGKKGIGYLTIGADDYAAIRLNDRWVGQTNQFLRLQSIVLPADAFRAGENELHITLRNIAMTTRDFYNPTGLTYTLDLIEAKD